MRNLASVVLAMATALVPAGALAQTPASGRALDITFNHGLVTLVARNVTVPEIMGEWARKGGSKVINAERIVGGPVTFEFHDVPEATVLQSVLRSASGFIAAPRRAGGPTGASVMEQVMILAVSRGNASAVITMPSTQVAGPVPIMGSPDDDIPPAQRLGPQPSPQVTPGPQSSAQPTAPMTSPTPGSVVVPPVKPGAPVQPGQIIKTPTA